LRIAAVGRALPQHYYRQDELLAEFRQLWAGRVSLRRVEDLHRNVRVGGRHLALPKSDYLKLSSFGDRNDAFIRCALDLGERALLDGLGRAGLDPGELRHLFWVSVTGIATPSIDARLINRLRLRRDLKRTPVFGLGCVAGAAGIARVADYLRAFPGEVAALLSVELCSLTLQLEDVSVANLIACGLFGDGAAAAILVGAERPADGPRVLASRSVFYPDTEHVMGWEVSGRGFQVVLSGDVPQLARGIRADVDAFLADQGLELSQIDRLVCHPGGPRVLEAFEEALERPREAFQVTWDSLRELGNLSSASVLMVLRDTLEHHRPPPGARGLMIAMGPGFCSELVLLQW
jgi:alkylresorcinol/alkylpyrone synthase